MASIIRVTKEFSFEMSHVLWNYDGPCRNVHGHSYKLFVTIAGVPVSDSENPKNGMVMDFTDLKKIVKHEIVDVFDHSVVVNGNFGKEKTALFSDFTCILRISTYLCTPQSVYFGVETIYL